MPRKKKKTSSETRAVEIFALRFPLSNSVYVGRSTCRKHWDLYDYYYKGRNITTKKAVEQHIAKDVYPQLFILDTVEKTKYAAYQERLAWYKYFIQHGFSVECEPSTKDILSDFDGKAEEIYQKIKDFPLDSIIAPEKDVAAGYRRKKPDQTVPKENPRYNVRFTAKEYEIVKAKAAEFGMSINDFLVSSAIKSIINRIEFDVYPIIECTNKIDQISCKLDGLISTIILSRVYFPADIAEIKDIENKLIETIDGLKGYLIDEVYDIERKVNRYR